MGRSDDKPRKASRVPAGRGERFARLGSMLVGIAGETALEALRRAAGQADAKGSLVLSKANARRVTATLADLRGAAMKLGQMLSLHGEDLLPPEFTEILAGLRNQAHLMPEAQVRGVLVAEFGDDWERLFREFDFEPLAAASIGQVHGATTRDGRDVALKLQYPGVRESISSDVDNLGVLLRVARILPVEIELDPLLAELKRELAREADYLREADNTERYARLVADDPMVWVPRVHRDLCTKSAIATDRVHARPLEDLRGAEHPQARRDRVGARLLRLVLRELFEFRFMQTDPNFANYLWLPRKEKIGLLDFGATREVPDALARGYAEILRSAIAGDRAALRRAALATDYLRPDEREDRAEGLLDLLVLVGEPLARPGLYDFGRSDLPQRLREGALELSLRRGLLRPPPPEAIFLHRKLAGVFLLCARLKARLDLRALVAPWLGTPIL
jgi:predicted unusual protein kinase regulating ubiquinone biosynthesis (AarF/ABC1/UbiB family)